MRLKHEEMVGVADEMSRRSGASLRNKPKVPDQRRFEYETHIERGGRAEVRIGAERGAAARRRGEPLQCIGAHVGAGIAPREHEAFVLQRADGFALATLSDVGRSKVGGCVKLSVVIPGSVSRATSGDGVIFAAA